MSEFITGEAAVKLLGVNIGSIRKKAIEGGWTVKKDTSGTHTKNMYKLENINEWIAERAAKGIDMINPRVPHQDAIDISKWADECLYMPTDEEIKARMTETYQFKDILSIIENRVNRGKTALAKEA